MQLGRVRTKTRKKQADAHAIISNRTHCKWFLIACSQLAMSPVLLLHTSKRAYTGVRDADHNSGPFKFYSLYSYDTGAVMYERESIKKSGNIGGSALRPLAMVVKEPRMHVGSLTSVRYASFLRFSQ